MHWLGELLARVAGADTSEPIAERDYRVTAWMIVVIIPLLATGNVLSRGVLANDSDVAIAAYDQFLWVNVPAHVFTLLCGVWMLTRARSAGAYRVCLYLALAAAVWTGITGLWLRGSLTHYLGLLLLIIAIAAVRVYLDWRLGLFTMATALTLHLGLVILEATGVLQPHALHPALNNIEYHRPAYMFAQFAWLAMAYLVTWAFASYVARRFRRGEQALRELNNSLEDKVKEQVSHIDRVNRLRRYMAPQVVEHMLAAETDPSDLRDRRVISVLFADLRGFTRLVETLDPGALEQMLNRYFDEVTTAAFAHGGTIDKFIGDAVMILFGAPESTSEADQAVRCVRTAIEIQRRLRAIEMVARIGIGTGEATVGSFGSAQRTEFTAVGTPVNRAARLEPLAPPGGVLVDERTHELCAAQFSFEPFGDVLLKGFAKPDRAFRIGAPSAV